MLVEASLTAASVTFAKLGRVVQTLIMVVVVMPMGSAHCSTCASAVVVFRTYRCCNRAALSVAVTTMGAVGWSWRLARATAWL